jgi:hypothetical protein
MTPLQNRLYWREWGWVSRTCKHAGHPVPDRHELHVKAIGFDKSHLDFSNEDLDQVLAEFRAITRPDDLAGQLRQQDQPRIRLLYSIRRLAPDPYARAIARGKFGTPDLDSLDLPQLRQLRITLTARARSKGHQAAATAAASF